MQLAPGVDDHVIWMKHHNMLERISILLTNPTLIVKDIAIASEKLPDRRSAERCTKEPFHHVQLLIFGICNTPQSISSALIYIYSILDY